MIVHWLESGSIGFEIPFFPLPSRKISWAMEMYNPNVNPYRNDTQIVQNIYKKLAAFSAREISLGTFLPEARTCFCSAVAQCTSDFPDSCVSASYRLCSGGGVVEVDGTMQHVNHSVWKGKSSPEADFEFKWKIGAACRCRTLMFDMIGICFCWGQTEL